MFLIAIVLWHTADLPERCRNGSNERLEAFSPVRSGVPGTADSLKSLTQSEPNKWRSFSPLEHDQRGSWPAVEHRRIY